MITVTINNPGDEIETFELSSFVLVGLEAENAIRARQILDGSPTQMASLVAAMHDSANMIKKSVVANGEAHGIPAFALEMFFASVNVKDGVIEAPQMESEEDVLKMMLSSLMAEAPTK